MPVSPKLSLHVMAKGWLSNSTIQTGATVRGGIVTGYIINEGSLADFDFRGTSIIGGTLAGTVTNTSKIDGWFQDVHPQHPH